MKYSLAALAALVAAAHGQARDSPIFLNNAFDVQSGKPFELRYSGCTRGCTITLKNGPSDNLKTVKVLTTSATGNSFSVTLDDSVPTGLLAFAIEYNQSRQVNYSLQFQYQGGAASASADTTSVASSTVPATTDSTSAMTMSSDSTSATAVSSDSMTTPSSTSASAEATSSASSMTSIVRNTTSTTSASSTGQTTSSTSIPTAGVGRTTVTWVLALSAVAIVTLLN